MTTVNSTNNTTYSGYSNNTTNKVNKELGQDEFLKLLVAQLKNQDPMSPMQDTDFIAQMAQFSALEQTSNMAKSIEKLTSTMTMLYSQSLLTQGAALIGKEAQAVDSTGAEITGIISSVSWQNNTLAIEIGDKEFGMENIKAIRQPGSTVIPPAEEPSESDTTESSVEGSTSTEVNNAEDSSDSTDSTNSTE